MNKYQWDVKKSKELRDKLINERLEYLYEAIQKQAHDNAVKVMSKAMDDRNYFTKRAGRKEKFAKDLNESIRPSYLKRDKFLKDVYAEEYRTSYFMNQYAMENAGLLAGYEIKLPRYTKKQFKQALEYPLSKLMNPEKLKAARTVDIEQLYDTIITGVQQGQSLPKININLDKKLGFRDSSGKWVQDIAERAGQQYKTQRILRTEIPRIREDATTDQWIQSQEIVESHLMCVEVQDDRTRRQSHMMDGQYANKDGEFLYPDGVGWHRLHHSGVGAFDINDRGVAVATDPEYPPEKRIGRDPVTGKNEILPYTNSMDWAKSKGLKRNKYGELLF